MAALRVWILVASGMLASACHDDLASSTAPAPTRGAASIRFLGDADEAAGFARATAAREFEFPADHSAHPQFRSEWWYFTGNLADAKGARFGFELTFFRIALAPVAAERSSAWGTNQLWMAHLTVTDEDGQRFVALERTARGGGGIAGSESEPFHVWVKDWSAIGSLDVGATTRLRALDPEMGIDLELRAVQGVVAHGDHGLDAKGPEVGNASYYYSVPRLAVQGSVRIGASATTVTGLAWMDREWSTSALSGGVIGWDWFSLHLSNGSDLMLYRLRDAAGVATAFSGGTFVAAGGEAMRFGASEFDITATAFWTSARTGVRYPVAWRLALPRASLELEVQPYVAGQEVDLTVRYWEGAVQAKGRSSDGPISGEGYLELAGY